MCQEEGLFELGLEHVYTSSFYEPSSSADVMHPRVFSFIPIECLQNS